MASRTEKSDVGSAAEEGLRLMISISVVGSSWVLKGVFGHAPSQVLVWLDDGEGLVWFCVDCWRIENGWGMERARHGVTMVKNGRICGSIMFAI